MIKNSDNSENEKASLISKFFKDLTNGNLGSKDLRFTVIYADIRRKAMLQSFTATGKDKIDGDRIM